MAMAMRRYSISFLSRRRLSTAAALASPPSPTPAKPSFSSRKAIKSSVRAESDPEKILALFESSTQLPRIYHDRVLYQISVSKLARLNRTDLVERLLESQKSDPASPNSESFFIRIMSLYADASMPDHAFRTFEQIPSRTEQSVCALLIVYIKQHSYDRVRELFDSIPLKYGIAPGVTAYNILLSALCNTGELQTARKTLDEMFEEKKLKPNIVSYNTLLSAYLKSGDEAGFDEILEEISRKEVANNIETYNLRISNFCNKKEILKAEKLLDELVSNGVQPNPTTFCTIIKGFCNEGDLDSAMKVWKRLKDPNVKHRVAPTADTYTVLLRTLVDKGDFTSALPICQECLKRRVPPPFEVMKALVSELVNDSKTEQANLLVTKMRKVANGCASDAWAKYEAELPL